jgi:hypothetical protein
MIELLKRPEGATVEQIAASTGWQHHTIRGAISGALKKKLGLTVEARRSAPTPVVGAASQARDTREGGPSKTGATGNSTVYRILAQAPARRRGPAERAAPRRAASNRAASAKTPIAKR